MVHDTTIDGYKLGKIIVQYCEENKTIISNSKSIFGEPFERDKS